MDPAIKGSSLYNEDLAPVAADSLVEQQDGNMAWGSQI